MAWTQTDVDTLRQAIVDRKFVKRITFADGQSADFDSIDDMLKLLSVMERAVAGGSGTRYASTSKGLW